MKTLMKCALAFMVAAAVILTGAGSGVEAAPKKHAGKTAYQHVYYLTEKIGPRVAGSENETKARKYIAGELRELNVKVEEQPFSYIRGNQTVNSANLIAVKDNPKTDRQVIVGAHYDSVAAGKGADDNASSVGVILESIESLDKKKLPYDLVVVFFGAEEQGLRGSNYYAGQMTEKQIDNTIGMINLDSLLAGDFLYVYGSPGDKGWIRDLALEIADKKKVPLQTNPGINPEYPAGTTGDWSDHAPFQRLGIPIGYFEATNWEIGAQDGYEQTVKHGGIWHTVNDNLEFLEREFPGRVQEHLMHFTNMLTWTLSDIKPDKIHR